MKQEITRDQLATFLNGSNAPLVIDVLNEDDYACGHIRGALNACVYNVTFLDDVAKLISDRDRSIVVYGSSRRDHSAPTAAGKLEAAGYARVAAYRGGIEEWRAGGLPIVEEKSATPPPSPRDGLHEIDTDKSRIEWMGRNLLSTHHGTLKLLGGEIELRSAHPTRGEFTVDMNSIENSDIADAEVRKVLIHHLKSDDFFLVERFPTARFALGSLTPRSNVPPGNPNCDVKGTLTIKDVTREIWFPAIIAITPEGTIGADAHLDVDRTQWNVLYGSGKFFEKLGKHLVNDTISLVLKLVTKPAPPLA